MSYPQNLIRKRRAMDETLPDGSTVTEAVGRLLSTISRNNAGLDVPPPLTRPRHYAPTIAPTTRMSDTAVTDSLPPEMPNTRPQGFSTPDAGYQNVIRPNDLSSPPTIAATSTQSPPASIISAANEETRPRIAVTPASSLINNYRNQPLETDTTISDAAPLQRPIQPYNTAPSTFGGNAVPIDAPVNSAIRPRITQSIDPVQADVENLASLRRAPIDYGQDAQGNQRTHGRKGIVGRAESFLKGMWDNYSRGGSAISALLNGGASAVNTDRNAQARRGREIQQTEGQLGNDIAIAGEQAKLGQIKAATDYTLQRPAIAAAQINARTQAAAIKDAQTRVQRNLTLKRGQKLDPNNPQDAALLQDAEDAGYHINPDEWNNSARNEVTVTKVDPDNPTQTIRVSLNRVTGEEKILGQAGYVQPVDRKTGMTAAQTTNAEIQREGLGIRREGVDIQREGLGIRQGEVSRQDQEYENKRQVVIAANADIDRQTGELKKQQDGAYAIANDPKRPAWEQVAARKRAEGLMKQIGSLERQKKAVPAERSMVTPQGRTAKPKLNEQSIRDAATKAGLDPAVAIQRAKARGQL